MVRFIEKPNAETAKGLIEKGCLWNSGYFLFRSDVMIEELEQHAPEVARAARGAVESAARDLDFTRLGETCFESAPRISIDFAVLERTARSGVYPVSFAWSDIGTWDAIWAVSPRNADGNFCQGRVEVFATSNSLIRSDGTLTAVVGLDNVVVVSTLDAVLVTCRDNAHMVKDLVSYMRDRRHPEVDSHLRIFRPWGWYQQADIGPRFRVKRILVQPGEQLSLQRHFHRAEHWVVVSGTAEVTIAGSNSYVHENEAVYIPMGATHRLGNPGRIPLEIIEVQVGSYTGEDDIVRLDDVYGRVASS